MNIRDIAKKAGVSVATISRAINQETRSKLSPKTLKLVDAVIQKYGYTPNLAARNLNRASSKTIGILFPYFYSIFNHQYYVDILAGVADALINTEYHFKILLSRESAPKWDKYDFRKGEFIDGLLITHWPLFFSGKAAVEGLKIPSILLNDYSPDLKAHFICGDQYQGGQIAAEHLYKLGHRRYALLAGSKGSLDGELRIKGFMDYLNSKKIIIEPHAIIQGDYRDDLAYERIGRMLELKAMRPSAVFCANDRMALGVLRRLKDAGINCPKEISVVGFDNDREGRENEPSLTSVQVSLYNLAREAALTLLKTLNGTRPSQSKIKNFFPSDLILRSSTMLV